MAELEIWRFMSKVGLVGSHAQFHKFSGSLHNSVWHVDTGYSSFVAKEYTTPIISTLFPNLPDKVAEAFRRLKGLDGAPNLIAFWSEVKLLAYDYVEYEMWAEDALVLDCVSLTGNAPQLAPFARIFIVFYLLLFKFLVSALH